MSYVENVWSEEFWEHFVRKYGKLRQYGSAVAKGQELRSGSFVEGRAKKARAGEANSWPNYPVTSGFDMLSELHVTSRFKILSKLRAKPSPALIGAYTVEVERIKNRHAARSALQTVRDKLLEVDMSILQKKVSNVRIDQPGTSASTSQHVPEASDLSTDDDNDSNFAYEESPTVDPVQAFADIHPIMCENHDRLALATMRNEIGDYLLLKYVNDIQQQRDIGWEEFYQYLNYMSNVRKECFL